MLLIGQFILGTLLFQKRDTATTFRRARPLISTHSKAYKIATHFPLLAQRECYGFPSSGSTANCILPLSAIRVIIKPICFVMGPSMYGGLRKKGLYYYVAHLYFDKDSMSDETNYPAIFENLPINIDQPEALKTSHSKHEVIAANVQVFNTKIDMLYQLLKNCKTFNQAMRLMDQMSTLMKERHNVLGQHYGPVENKGSNSNRMVPLD
jgi:hypothetical protein